MIIFFAQRGVDNMNLVPGSTVLEDRCIPVTRALFSCYDKEQLGPFVEFLHDRGVEILSSSGTAKAIEALGIPVRDIAGIIGWSQMSEGRVSTLHPRIHWGILCDWRKPDHRHEAEELNIEQIDLVCVFTYPFEEALEKCLTPDELVENIDIGGPCLLRAAAKNFANVTATSSPGL